MNIIEAVKNNDIDAVRRCIARNEDVNAKDNDGWPALMLASCNGHLDTAELLLRSGADVNAKNKYGNTALTLALRNGHSDTAELLLRSGADVNAKKNNGDTALMWASRNGHPDIAELLLRSGADVNAKNNNGDTALIWASCNGHSDTAELLLRSGCKHPNDFGGWADVNAKNNVGWTALIWASSNGHSDTAKRIVSVAMDDPCVPYTTVALSSFVPRWENMSAQDYAGLVTKVIPVYLDRAVENPMFANDMQRDIEKILGGKTERNGEPLTDKNKTLLSKILKTLRSIDYTDQPKRSKISESLDSDETSSYDYDMEL